MKDDHQYTIERNTDSNLIEICIYDKDGFFIRSIDVTDQAIQEVLDYIFIANGVTENGEITLERHIDPNQKPKREKKTRE